MAFSRTSDREVLEARTGGGCLTLFGIPFLLGGLFVMTSPLDLIPAKNQPPPWPVALLFGGIFAAVGAAFVFGRAGKIVDRRARTVTTWWGLLVPFAHTVYRLDEFDRVTISREVRRSKNSTYTVYPVRFEGRTQPVKLEEPQAYAEARQDAEQLAKFLRWPVADSSEGTPVVREPDRLDESLRDRARRTGERFNAGSAPQRLTGCYQLERRRLAVELPPPGFGAGQILPIVAALFFGGIVAATFVPALVLDPKTPTGVRVLVLAFGAVIILGPLLLAILSGLADARRRERVVATPESLRLERRGLVGTETFEIPGVELEELVMGGSTLPTASGPSPGPHRVVLSVGSRGRGIRARSDRATFEFGAHLVADEQRWLHAAIMQVMTG